MLRLFSRRPAPLRHAVVTTFHAKGYETYGRRCIETFLARWPASVGMLVYAEDVAVDVADPRLTVLDHVASLPELRAFRAAYAGNPYANGTDPHGSGKSGNFRWDAVRFVNKVFAVTDALRRLRGTADHMIWLDADTVTHADVPADFLDGIAPRDGQLAAYLNRKSYPECGWVGYNLRHPLILDFAERFERTYLDGRFLELKESHDSFVFWSIVKDMEAKGEAGFKKLGDDRATGHIFINSALGAYFDHLKGDRKAAGRSRDDDLRAPRREAWWRR